MKKVEKFEAAEQQLITAIDLFFKGKSEVAVHTLARAAHEILDTLCAKNNLTRGIINEGIKDINPNFHKIIFKKVNEAKNFFKHANKETDYILWNPDVSIHFIWDATSLYRRLKKENLPYEILIFSLWYRVQFHDMFKDMLDEQISNAKEELANISKLQFYQILLDKCKRGEFKF